MAKSFVALALGAGIGVAGGVLPASAEPVPVEYVKFCSTFGASYYYIPGTDTCLNPNTGETRQVTEAGVKQGQTEVSTRVGNNETAIAETNEQLAKSNNKISKLNNRVDDLEQSQAALERRFNDSFEESIDGVAIAMALSAPDLVAGERFAMKMNLGTYNGSNAFGFTVAGVLARTDFGRVTMSGGVATTGGNTGGNVGMQLSW